MSLSKNTSKQKVQQNNEILYMTRASIEMLNKVDFKMRFNQYDAIYV